MFGMRHHGRHGHDDSCGGRFAAGRGGWRGRHGTEQGGGRGGRHGMGGGEMRPGRVMGQGDLQLIALALIAEQPRHGYEIIKLLEEKTDGWYAPSPGIVYPTLTYLEEAGYVTGQADGAKKLFSITETGQARVAENRTLIDALLARLTAVGDKIAKMRRRMTGDDDRGPAVPTLVKAALDNLRSVAAERFADDPDVEAKLVEILARAAGDLKRAMRD